MEQQKKILVLSVDALVADDMEYLSTLPNFQKYMAGGAAVEKMRSIYPTVTYPAHTSIITGTYPNRHKVYSNDHFEAGLRKYLWRWFADNLVVPDIFSAAKAKGLKTASVFWPVTGNHPHIDYLIDEYWAQSKEETSRDAFSRAGTSEEVLTRVVDKHIDKLVDRVHPGCDYFVVKCACDIIREFAPDLIALHPANIDAYRHQTGLFNETIRQGLREVDEWIGMLAGALQDAGTLEHTDFILLSDHGQLELKRIIHPNVVFADHGLIQYDSEGKLTQWKAFCHSLGMSAAVYLKDPDAYDEVYQLLRYMKDEQIYGISEVYTETEANEKEHLGGDFSFILETDGYTSFGDNYIRPIVTNYNFSDYRFGRASHGYLPDKGPQPVFYAKGPSFKEGAVLDCRSIVDIAPTLARVLGVCLPDTDGVAMEELLVV